MNVNDVNYYKLCRETAGFTQEQVIDMLHVSVRALSAYENGANVPDDVVDLMAQLYHMPLLACWHMKHHSRLGKYLPEIFEPQSNGDMVFQLIIAGDDLHPSITKIKSILRDLNIDEDEKTDFKEQLDNLKSVAGQIMSAVYHGEKELMK